MTRFLFAPHRFPFSVCYSSLCSWWILSALSILGRVPWIDGERLVTFILECQDPEAGGIADRPGNMADV